MEGRTVLLCCVFCWTVTAAQSQSLAEGEVCKDVDGVKWSWKLLKHCPTALEGLSKRGESPQNFSFSGNETIICCSPGSSASPPSSPGIKSKQMCQKYADAVYIRIPDLMTDDEISYDTCAWREENTGTVKGIAVTREFPHMAMIGVQKEGEEIKWKCEGSLISERFVLSAARCAGDNKNTMLARVGDYNIKTDADEEMVLAQPTNYKITEIITHPDYPRRIYTNDIALFKLNDSVLFTEFIRPICLQTEHDLPETHAIFTRWDKYNSSGKNSGVLMKANLTILSAKQCKGAYGPMIYQDHPNDDGDMDASIICAASRLDIDTCLGSAGNQLQKRLKEPYCMHSQVGIYSFGRTCGAGYPGGFTRVSHFVSWIESIVWP